MSTPAAAGGVTRLTDKLLPLQTKLRDQKRKSSDNQAYNVKKAQAEAQQKIIEKLPESKLKGLRVGIVPMSADARPVYYRFVQSTNLETPYRLEHTGDFPVFTVKNNLYLLILNHRQSDKPGDFVLSYGTDKAAVIDVAPLRPTIDQPSPIKGIRAASPELGSMEVDFADAFVDRVLPFANKLPGETILTVTVSSYGQVVTANKEEATSSGTTTTLTKETKTVKLLDAEKCHRSIPSSTSICPPA